MILVQRRLFLSLIALAAAGFTGLSVFAYRFLLAAPGMDPERLKILAERFFLAGILGGGIFVILLVTVALRSLHFSRALEKLAALSRSRGFSPVQGLRKLGRVGNQLAEIVYDMNRLSEKKSLKIGALNNLCDNLVQGHEDALGITNVKGEVLYVSRRLTEGLKLNRADMIGRSLTEFLPDREVPAYIVDVFNTLLPVTLPGTEVTLYPVMNQKKEPSFIIFHFKKIPGETRKPVQKTLPGMEKRVSGTKRLMDRFKKFRSSQKTSKLPEKQDKISAVPTSVETKSKQTGE